MSSRTAKVIILCEGVEDYDFVRRALVRLGWNKRLFEPRICPSGAQSGEQFVRENYARELRAQRARRGVKLLICTDADLHEVSERARQLAASLQTAGEPQRRRDEHIALWIPRRNLETWVYLYARGPVDEAANYKHEIREEDLKAAALGWGDDLKRKSIKPRRCRSLELALTETERIRD